MRGRRRGQTLPDFAVGIAIFLITVTFLFLFVPQVTLPYEDQEQPVVADRVASGLGNQLLADGEVPSKLNETCTLAFFTQSGQAGCPFETADPVADQLGVDSAYSVNVTLRNTSSDAPDSAILCENGGAVGDCDSDDERLAVGPSVPRNDRSVATARRRVFLEETSAVIEVGVW